MPPLRWLWESRADQSFITGKKIITCPINIVPQCSCYYYPASPHCCKLQESRRNQMNEIKLNLKSLSLFSFSFWSQNMPLVVHQLRCVCSLQNNYFFCPHFVALFYLSLQRVKRLELDQLNTSCSLKYYLCSTSIHYVLSKHRFGIEINVMNYRVRVPLHYLDSFPRPRL